MTTTPRGFGKTDAQFRKGSCVICGRPTDTAIVVRGMGEYIVGVLVVLGLPHHEACWMVSNATGCDIGKVPIGEVDMPIKVCQRCAGAIPGLIPVPMLDGAHLPLVRERRLSDERG